MTVPEASKTKPQKHKKLMLVRYGKIGFLGWFEHQEPEIPKTAKSVVIKTERGLELGEVVGVFNYRAGHYRHSKEQIENYFYNRTKDYPLGGDGEFVRFASSEDLMENKHLEKSAAEEAAACQKFADEMNLDMKVIEAEHLFGGERIIIYFSSAGRVDFRELVKKLAREYQTRIELRQIGSRDEAKLISDFENCGQECCCRRFLKILEPVNMRMAKLQKATLDPSKISGHCGRLKCCLRYEDQTYRDLKSRLPRRNTLVKTPNGQGRVSEIQVLTQLVEVMYDSGKKEAWRLDEIEILQGQPSAPAGADHEDDTEHLDESAEADADFVRQDLPVPLHPAEDGPEQSSNAPQPNQGPRPDKNNYRGNRPDFQKRGRDQKPFGQRNNNRPEDKRND